MFEEGSEGRGEDLGKDMYISGRLGGQKKEW